MPNVSLATRLQLVEFLRGTKFPLAHSARNLPQYTHAAQKPLRPTGCQQTAKPQQGQRAPAGGKIRRFLLPPRRKPKRQTTG
jgi:hypothetical protein